MILACAFGAEEEEDREAEVEATEELFAGDRWRRVVCDAGVRCEGVVRESKTRYTNAEIQIMTDAQLILHDSKPLRCMWLYIVGLLMEDVGSVMVK